jgi:hypothetical protein
MPPESFADHYSSLQIMRIVALVVAVAVAAAQKAADPDVKLLQKTSEILPFPSYLEYQRPLSFVAPLSSLPSPLSIAPWIFCHSPYPRLSTRFTRHPFYPRPLPFNFCF